MLVLCVRDVHLTSLSHANPSTEFDFQFHTCVMLAAKLFEAIVLDSDGLKCVRAARRPGPSFWLYDPAKESSLQLTAEKSWAQCVSD